MADEENVEEGAKIEPPKKSSRNPIVTLMLIVNAALIATVGFFQYQQHQKEASRPSIRDVVRAQMKRISEEGLDEEGESKASDEKKIGQMFPLESFTANLAQGDGPRRYLRLNTVLRFSNDSKPEEFKARAPQIRDTIISIINSKRPEDLLKVEGKSYLKEEIRAAINSFLIDGHIVDVYYVDFQIH